MSYRLPSSTHLTILPTNNGYITYQQVDTLVGIAMPEINRVAQAWILAHTGEFGLEWQPPVYKAELLYAGQIAPKKIQPSNSDYYAKRTVHYLLTISAQYGTYRLLLTNFDVVGTKRQAVHLETLISDQALRQSVDREATLLLQSLRAHIRKTAQRPL